MCPVTFMPPSVMAPRSRFMALTYFLIRCCSGAKRNHERAGEVAALYLRSRHGGVALFLMGAGTLGVPRRHWDIGLTGNVLVMNFRGRPTCLMAWPASVACSPLSAWPYILITVGSILWGKKSCRTGVQRQAGPRSRCRSPRPSKAHGGIGVGGFAAPAR